MPHRPISAPLGARSRIATFRQSPQTNPPTWRVSSVPTYSIEVVRGGIILYRCEGVVIDLENAWPLVSRIAEELDAPGARIRVRDQQGRIAIMVGIATARITY
jgi:hypothetical protein